MAEVSATQRANAPVERVWAVATDLAHAPERIAGIDSVELLAGGEAFGVGTRWRETRTMMGRSATEEMWVTAVDPPRSYTVEAESHGTHYTSVFAFEPDGDGTRLTMTFSGKPLGLGTKLLAATLGRAMSGSMAKMIGQDLADIAQAAERG